MILVTLVAEMLPIFDHKEWIPKSTRTKEHFQQKHSVVMKTLIGLLQKHHIRLAYWKYVLGIKHFQWCFLENYEIFLSFWRYLYPVSVVKYRFGPHSITRVKSNVGCASAVLATTSTRQLYYGLKYGFCFKAHKTGLPRAHWVWKLTQFINK